MEIRVKRHAGGVVLLLPNEHSNIILLGENAFLRPFEEDATFVMVVRFAGRTLVRYRARRAKPWCS